MAMVVGQTQVQKRWVPLASSMNDGRVALANIEGVVIEGASVESALAAGRSYVVCGRGDGFGLYFRLNMVAGHERVPMLRCDFSDEKNGNG
jgi:hypothetical protein